jgi:MarR family 2-MHQ and catechol resistance regulon transcriptional repressor
VVLSRSYAAIAEHAKAHAAAHDLTAQEFGVLEALYHKGDMFLGELQEKILVSSGGVTYLVDRLAEKGLVERKNCQADRRARYASLTTKGKALIGKIFPEHAAWLDNALGGLTVAERQEATRLLKDLGRHAAAAQPGTT